MAKPIKKPRKKQEFFRNALVVDGKTLAKGEFADSFVDWVSSTAGDTGNVNLTETINETVNLVNINSAVFLQTALPDIGNNLIIDSSNSSNATGIRNANSYNIKGVLTLTLNKLNNLTFHFDFNSFIDIIPERNLVTIYTEKNKGIHAPRGVDNAVISEKKYWTYEIDDSPYFLLADIPVDHDGYNFSIQAMLYLSYDTNSIMLLVGLQSHGGIHVTGDARQTYIIDPIAVEAGLPNSVSGSGSGGSSGSGSGGSGSGGSGSGGSGSGSSGSGSGGSGSGSGS